MKAASLQFFNLPYPYVIDSLIYAQRPAITGDASLQAVPETGSNGHRPQNLKSMVRGLKDGAETKAIAEALRQTNWRRKDAARLLGISYKALLYKMRQFGCSSPSSNNAANAADTHLLNS